MKFGILRYLIALGASLRKEKPVRKDVSQMSGQVDKKQIEEWKHKYGGVYCFVSDDMRIGYFQNPTLQILDRCEVQCNGSKQRFNKLMVESCWLGGDEMLKQSEKHLLGLYKWLPHLIEITEGILAKL